MYLSLWFLVSLLLTIDCYMHCHSFRSPADVLFDVTIIPQAGANIIIGPKTTCEPKIRSYAAKYDTLPNLCFNNLTQSQQYANAKGFTAPFTTQQQVADYVAGSSNDTAAIKKAVGVSS